jgi:hypothetical protein
MRPWIALPGLKGAVTSVTKSLRPRRGGSRPTSPKLPKLLQRPTGAINEAVLAICDRMAEVQALLDDHIAGGKHAAADVVAKAQGVLSETELLRAMFDVGYFPPSTPPGK